MSHRQDSQYSLSGWSTSRHYQDSVHIGNDQSQSTRLNASKPSAESSNDDLFIDTEQNQPTIKVNSSNNSILTVVIIQTHSIALFTVVDCWSSEALGRLCYIHIAAVLVQRLYKSFIVLSIMPCRYLRATNTSARGSTFCLCLCRFWVNLTRALPVISTGSVV